MWFRAMWYVTSQKNGASALGLQRVLGLSSYETAWTWLHKLRRAMIRPDRDRLSGWIGKKKYRELNREADRENAGQRSFFILVQPIKCSL